MSESTYQRTTGGRHKWKKLAYLPLIMNGVAHMKSGAQYLIRDDGWRKVSK